MKFWASLAARDDIAQASEAPKPSDSRRFMKTGALKGRAAPLHITGLRISSISPSQGSYFFHSSELPVYIFLRTC